jgi:hypothetical protein
METHSKALTTEQACTELLHTILTGLSQPAPTGSTTDGELSELTSASESSDDEHAVNDVEVDAKAGSSSAFSEPAVHRPDARRALSSPHATRSGSNSESGAAEAGLAEARAAAAGDDALPKWQLTIDLPAPANARSGPTAGVALPPGASKLVRGLQARRMPSFGWYSMPLCVDVIVN